MTSQPQGKSLETLCKDCLFAIYEDKTQTGCKAKRLNTFHESSVVAATDGQVDFYAIKGLCSSYRPPYWNSGEADLEKMRSEMQVDFTLIIDLEDYSREDLLEIGKMLENVFYYEKVQVVLGHRVTYPHKDIVTQIIHRWMSTNKLRIVQYHEDLTKVEADAELLSYAKGLFFSMSPLSEYTEGIMRTINKMATIDFNRFVVAEKSGTVMMMLSALKLYRTNDGKTFKDFEAYFLDEAKKANLYCKL